MNLEALRVLYHRTLLEDVVPFWMRHAIDPNGGINTCLSDDGVLQSRDRWNWSQWRAVWVFSALYNRIEPRAEWLETALGIYRFVSAHGPLPDGHWPLLLDGDGNCKRGYESIYVDGFALYGMAELYRVTREPKVLAQALRTFEAANTALESETPPPAWPYPIPAGWRAHGVSMLFSLACHELAEVSGDALVRSAALRHHRLVMDTFLSTKRGLVLEWLNRSGCELPPPQGTAVVPGHAIETMWFQMHIAHAGNDEATLDRAAQAIRRHLEAGWDAEYGGLRLALDADGRADVAWGFADTKLWWPQTEALYATLLAHAHGAGPWALEWHERIRAYCFSHYPYPAGEWRQRLDRKGNPMTEVVALPVKDPFHLPRALILCLEVLKTIVPG